MKKINYLLTLFVIILALLTFHNSFSQVNQEWVARYDGPGNSLDRANSIAVDGSGNVYVTGSSAGSGTGDDYATIKYNSSGDSVWVARYNGPGNSYDYASSIAVDGSGNVYVTGNSIGSGTDIDYATIKYNSSGDSVWVKRYNGPGNSDDYASSIVVDTSGNVYVTGSSGGSVTHSDYTTIKYNSSGIEQWVERYNGPGNSFDAASSISVDGSGNVYVTGQIDYDGAFGSYGTIKYNSAGVQQWVARYNGPENSVDGASSIAVDGSGNVYVTGNSPGSGTDNDYATIKYNSSGVQQWVARYNGPGNSSDEASSIAVDGSDNVYVTGYSIGSGTERDYATIKYNSTGVQQWVVRYNGPGNYNDVAFSIVLDDSGDVYVTGWSSGSGTASDYGTIKYNSAGVQQWVARYNGSNFGDQAFSIAVDGSGNVYVTGSSGFADYATIKYSQSTGIIQLSSIIPEQFSLTQNYPNPFNPSTKINYELRITSYATLVVYDIMGKEITTLVNEKQSAGKYQFEFDSSGLPSGVYFYRLNAGDFTDTKRMMLVK